STWRGGLPAEAEQVLPRLAPELLGSAISDYREKNRDSQPLPSEFRIDGTEVVLLSEDAIRSQFHGTSTAQGWGKFRQSYGESQLYTFSRVGISHDLSQAVVFMGYQGARIGTGSVYFLHREGRTWRVL